MSALFKSELDGRTGVRQSSQTSTRHQSQRGLTVEQAARVLGEDLVAVLAGLHEASDDEVGEALQLMRSGSLETLRTAGIIVAGDGSGGADGRLCLTKFGHEMTEWGARHAPSFESRLSSDETKQRLKLIANKLTD